MIGYASIVAARRGCRAGSVSGAAAAVIGRIDALHGPFRKNIFIDKSQYYF
jgi:hypothetical protein